MVVTYLDNSNLNLLSELKRRDPGRYRRFLHRWAEHGAVLAVSMVHYVELAGSDFPEARDARYSVIEDLVPVRSDMILDPATPSCLRQVSGREVMIAIAKRLNPDGPLSRLDRYWAGFPSIFADAELLRGARTFEDPDIREALRMLDAGAKLATNAASRPEGTKYKRTKAADLDCEPPPREQIDKLIQAGQEAAWADPEVAELFASLPPEVRDDARQRAQDIMDEMFRSMSESGPLNGVASLMNAEPDEIRGMYLDDVGAQSVLREKVGQVAAEVFGITEEHQARDLQSTISLRNCPGMWIRHNTELELRRGVCHDVPSTYFDLDHLAHLPYADIFFCDKRIAHYVRQAHQRESGLEIWERIRPPIAVPATVEAIEEALSRGPFEW
jgi:hypothetical protein